LYTSNPPPIEEIGTYIPLRSNNEEHVFNNIPKGVEALPKQPIPQEHVKIQLVLEELQSRLLEVAPTAVCYNMNLIANYLTKTFQLFSNIIIN